MKKLILSTLVAIGLIGSASASNWYVSTNGVDSNIGSYNAPFATIQHAINLASNGDRVYVLRGTYTGIGNYDLNFNGKAIALQSIEGPYSTIINLANHTALYVGNGETQSTVISGFSFINGYSVSGADWDGAGIITISNKSAIKITNCIFYNNLATVSYVTSNASIIYSTGNATASNSSYIQNCLFYSNTCSGGFWGTYCFASVIRNGGPGQVIPCFNATNVTIVNNNIVSIYGNTTNRSTLVYALRGFRSLDSCIVWNNSKNGCASIEANSNNNIVFSILQNGSTTNSDNTVLTNDPLFIDSSNGNFSLQIASPARNRGNPSLTNNVDGTRADMGFRSNLATPITVSVQNLTTNDFSYTTNSNSAVILTYTGSNSSVTIPSTIGGLPVTSIGDNSFANQSNILTITIPNAVTNIGSGAFSGCSNLSQVTIPDSVVSFGTGIFSASSNVAINGSQSLISYLSQNADSLGFTGNALSSIQNGGVASGSYGWIKNWLLSDNSFLSSIASLIQFPSPAAQNLSNSIAALSAQTSTTNPAFISAVAAQILQGSNNFGIAVKQNQSLNFPTIPSITIAPAKKYTNTIASSSGLPVVQTVGNTAIATISNSVLTIIGEGTTTVTASQSGNALWNPVTASQPLIVVKGSQSIAFPPIAVQNLAKTAVLKLTATSSANLPISYIVQNNGIAINRTSNSLTLIGTGTTTITATNAGNQYFYPSSATQTLIVK